ncbi:molybdenum cofactor CnxF [Myxozyma melibiosi]|uniref:Molybdenum cofactor CnxF n=1 Tax=Myxozyma melibiosi TaxID=54550 RepID=A0ABR1EZB2_9ASCO
MDRRAQLQAQISLLQRELDSLSVSSSPPSSSSSSDPSSSILSLDEYTRYGRQMLVPELGKPGQLSLRASSVLVVGAGGLGSPALLYLAGAGVGRIGIVDHDTVSLSNLPRQTLYTVADVGLLKVDAAVSHLRQRNPSLAYTAYPHALTADIALEIVAGYDVVLDCTDSPMSRYLLGDATSILDIPLVSASALRTEAQLLVLNRTHYASPDRADAPCYRCIFPSPPSYVDACSDAGIVGPVVGTAGVLQALEAIKLLAARAHPELYGEIPGMLLFNTMSARPFRTIRMRRRQQSCKVCGAQPEITKQTVAKFDYAEFCHTAQSYPDMAQYSIPVADLARVLNKQEQVHLIDVRDKTQFEICALPGSIHIPLSHFLSGKLSSEQIAMLEDQRTNYIVCRYGNDSRTAVKWIRENLNAEKTFNVWAQE